MRSEAETTVEITVRREILMNASKVKKAGVMMTLAFLTTSGLGAPLNFSLGLLRAKAAQEQPAVAVPDGMERITSVEGITEYRVKSNGLRVLLFPDQAKPTIT